MTYNSEKEDSEDQVENDLLESVGKVVKGLGLDLLELTVFKTRGKRKAGSVQVRLIVYKGLEPVSIEDCSKAHKAVLPRLEMVFGKDPAFDIYVEVSSPGINRLIKEGREFAHFTGQQVKCYRTDIFDWTCGTLVSSDEKGIVLNTENGEMRLAYEIIGKARLSCI